jgi:hypothetical protein
MGRGEKIVPSWKGTIMKKQIAFAFFQLPIAVAITMFIAGLIVPSLTRSDLATNRAAAAGTLHTMHIAGTAFSYTNQNIGFAMMGMLAGTAAALALHFRAAAPENAISARLTTLRAALLRH